MGAGLREGTAAEAGMSAKRLDGVRDLAAGWVEDGMHPALAVLVARRGVIVLHEAFGRLGPDPGDPALTRDALWPLASVGKPVTATLLMMLVEEGRVGLTRPVREYLPEFAGEGKDAVYVHHLLTHTSGVEGPVSGSDELVEVFTGRVEGPVRDSTLHPVIDALLQIAYERPLRKPPGEEMYYDTINYELIGEIIQRVSGQHLAEFVRNRIFDPLGMTDSYWTVPDDLADRLVRVRAKGLLAFAWQLPLSTIPSGGSGGCSTVRDMALFGQAFLDGGRGEFASILGSATVDAMVTNQIPGVPGALAFLERHDEASWGYGWGIASLEKWNSYPTHPPGTFSPAGATATYLWCDQAHALVGVFFGPMTNEKEPGIPWWQADLFANAVTAAIDD